MNNDSIPAIIYVLEYLPIHYFFFFFFFFNLTYSRWTSSLPSCLWSLRIFLSFPRSRLTIFHRDTSSALLQPVNQWLNFTSSRSHAFRYERKNTNPTLVRIELTTFALLHSGDECYGAVIELPGIKEKRAVQNVKYQSNSMPTGWRKTNLLYQLRIP